MGSHLSSMKFLLVSALCLLAASQVSSTCLCSINVKDYGEVFIVAPDWCAGAISIQDNGFTMRGNSRLYFASRCENGWVGDMYAQIPLNNKHFAYQLNLANVPCHCNAAAYFVKMPGTNAFNVDNRMMCPDGGCKINTAQPFTISHYQNSQQANTWMGQGGQDASFNMCNDGGYLGNMATSYDGMVFTASLWGGGGIDMGWLDGMTGCGGDCNIDGASVTFSNFELWE